MDYDEFDEDRERAPKKRRKFNKRLDTNYLSVDEHDDSFRAQLIRTVATGVSRFITPRQLISALFILAAYTTIFLASTIIADLSFIFFEIFDDLSEEASMKLGNVHDAKLRAFGVIFAVMAILVELDSPFIKKRVAVFKSFIPRSILLLFVATLSDINPMVVYESMKNSSNDDDNGVQDDFNPNTFYSSNGYNNNVYQSNAYQSSYSNKSNNYNSNSNNYNSNSNNYNSNSYNSGYYNGYGYNDDYTSNFTSSFNSNKSSSSTANGLISEEFPDIVLKIQSISASLLQVSVIIYFIAGLLCLDQFAPHAFVPNHDNNKISPDHLPKELSRRNSKMIQANSDDADSTEQGQEAPYNNDYTQYDDYAGYA